MAPAQSALEQLQSALAGIMMATIERHKDIIIWLLLLSTFRISKAADHIIAYRDYLVSYTAITIELFITMKSKRITNVNKLPPRQTPATGIGSLKAIMSKLHIN